MKKTILTFSLLILGILLLFQISKYALFTGNLNIELVTALVAILFFFVGVYLNEKVFKQKNTTKDTESNIVDYQQVKALNISRREYEVLQAISENLTNKEIAQKLFISESTTKSHVSRLLSKLEVDNRIKLIDKAKSLKIL